VQEYLALSVIARDLREACEAPQEPIDELIARARADEDRPVRAFWARLGAHGSGAGPRRWATVAVAAATFGIAAVGMLALWEIRPTETASGPRAAATLRFETRHGEQQTHVLADNSVLHLNTDSAVTIRYDAKQRLVVLEAGEADFEVAHEASRAFRVFAGPAEVVDIGTRFDVRLKNDSALVTVIEGRVAVAPSLEEKRGPNTNSGRSPRFVEVSADQLLQVYDGEWPPATPIPVDERRTTSWLHRQIVFDHEPLELVASEFNRYAPKPIEITTPGLQQLEISGVFATDDTAAFIAFLRSLEHVRVEETATRIRVSRD
jgi:transmembrane sensor